MSQAVDAMLQTLHLPVMDEKTHTRIRSLHIKPSVNLLLGAVKKHWQQSCLPLWLLYVSFLCAGTTKAFLGYCVLHPVLM